MGSMLFHNKKDTSDSFMNFISRHVYINDTEYLLDADDELYEYHEEEYI